MLHEAATLTLLATQILAAGLVVIALHALSSRVGLSLLFVFVGSNQFVQNLLLSTVQFELFGRYPVSPGSAALFSSSLAAILLVYLTEGIATTRRLIYSILLANLSLAVLAISVKWGLSVGLLGAIAEGADWFMVFDLSLYTIGSILLVVDTLLIPVVFEVCQRRVRWLSLGGRLILTLTLVLLFDALAFVLIGFRGAPALAEILTGNLIGKGAAALILGSAISVYVTVRRPEVASRQAKTGPLSIVTYRERLDELEEEHQKLLRSVELEHAHARAKEKRLSAVLDATSDFVAITDLDQRIIYLNSAARHLIGTEPDEVPGELRIETCYAPDGARVLREVALPQALERGSWSGETTLRTHSGEEVPCLQVVLAHHSPSGEVEFVSTVARDISKLKQIERELQESEKRYELASAAGKVGVWDWNLETNEIYVEPRLKAMLGFQDDEIRNHLDDWGRRVHPGDMDEVMEAAQKHLENLAPVYEVAHRMLHKDGSIRWFLARGSAILGEGGEPIRMVGTDTDITDLRAKELEIQILEAKYRDLFEHAPGSYVITHSEGGVPIIVDCNHDFLSRLGYDASEVIGRPLTDFYTSESTSQLIERGAYQRALRGELGDEERQLVAKSGEIVETLVRALPELDAAGQVVGTRAVYIDIGRIKNAERELREYQRKLQNLTDRLERIREEESIHIAREIHDELGQALTALRLDLSWLRNRSEIAESEARTRVDSLIGLVDRLIDEVRDLCSRLRPTVLDDLGLRPAIEWHVKQFSDRSGVGCSLELEGEIDLHRERAVAVFRILQEALTNIGRHAEASSVRIRVHQSDDTFVLEIVDNGTGISRHALQSPSSIGLVGMRERARSLGGRLRIESDRGRGTSIRLSVPT